MLGELTQSGAIPALEAVMRFAGARQRIIAGNIANITTPNYQPMDVSVGGFQAALRQAIQARRERTGGADGEFRLPETDEISPGAGSEFRLNPTTSTGGLLQHDRNNGDLERMNQDLVENATAYRIASDLLRTRYEMLRSAIAERVA